MRILMYLAIISIVLLSGCTEIDLCSTIGFCEDTAFVKTTTEYMGPKDVLTVSDIYTIPGSPIPPDNSVLLTFILKNNDNDPRRIAENVIVDLYDAPTFYNPAGLKCNAKPSENCRSNQCNNMNEYSPCKLLPTAEKPITFNLKSPSEGEIVNIITNPVLAFKVNYDFSSSTLFDVVVVNPVEIVKRQKAGESLPMSQSVVFSSGPVKTEAEVQGEKYVPGDGNMDAVIIFTVKDEGRGALKNGAIASGKMKIEFPLGLADNQLNNIVPHSTRQQTTGGGLTVVDISGGAAGTTGGTAGGTTGVKDDSWCKAQAKAAGKENDQYYKCVDTSSDTETKNSCETGTGIGGDSNWCDQSKGIKCCIPDDEIVGMPADNKLAYCSDCFSGIFKTCNMDKCQDVTMGGKRCYWVETGWPDKCLICPESPKCSRFDSRHECETAACGLIKTGNVCIWADGSCITRKEAENTKCFGCFLGVQSCNENKCQDTKMNGIGCYWFGKGSLPDECRICPEKPTCTNFNNKDECETSACGLIKIGGECIWTGSSCISPSTSGAVNVAAGDVTSAVVSNAITGMATASKCGECGAGKLEACDLQECIGLGSDCYFAPYSSTVPQYGYCKECPTTGAACSLFTLSEMCKANHCSLQCAWAGSSCVAASSASKCSEIKNREQCTLGPLDCHWSSMGCSEGSLCNDQKTNMETCHDMGTYCYFDNSLGASDVLGKDGTCRRCDVSTSCSKFNTAAECNADRVCTAKCEMQGTTCVEKKDKILATGIEKPLFICGPGDDKDKIVCTNIEPIDLYKGESAPLYFRIKAVPAVLIYQTYTIKVEVFYSYELKGSLEVEIKPWRSRK